MNRYIMAIPKMVCRTLLNIVIPVFTGVVLIVAFGNHRVIEMARPVVNFLENLREKCSQDDE